MVQPGAVTAALVRTETARRWAAQGGGGTPLHAVLNSSDWRAGPREARAAALRLQGEPRGPRVRLRESQRESECARQEGRSRSRAGRPGPPQPGAARGLLQAGVRPPLPGHSGEAPAPLPASCPPRGQTRLLEGFLTSTPGFTVQVNMPSGGCPQRTIMKTTMQTTSASVTTGFQPTRRASCNSTHGDPITGRAGKIVPIFQMRKLSPIKSPAPVTGWGWTDPGGKARTEHCAGEATTSPPGPSTVLAKPQLHHPPREAAWPGE